MASNRAATLAIRTLIIAVLVIGFLSSVSRAQGFVEEADHDLESLSNIEYVEDAWKYSAPNDDRLISSLESDGLVDMTEEFAPISARLGIAHVLVSDSMDKMIAFRYDFVPKDSRLLGRVIKLPTGRWLLHTKTASKRHVAIVFEGFKQAEINPISLKISQSKSPRTSASMMLLNLMVPKAQAKGHDCGTIALPIQAAPNGSAAQGRTSPSKVMKQLSTCGKAFMTAVADSLDLGALAFFRGEWIDGLKSAYRAVKYVMTSGPSALWEELKSISANLSDELMTAAFCYVLSSFAADAVISIATGGLGLAKFVSGFMMKIKRVKSMISIIMETERMRGLRTLSSAVKDREFTPRVRGDVLRGATAKDLAIRQRADQLRVLSPFVQKVNEVQTAETTMTRALKQATCVARSEAHELAPAMSTARHNSSPNRNRGPASALSRSAR